MSGMPFGEFILIILGFGCFIAGLLMKVLAAEIHSSLLNALTLEDPNDKERLIVFCEHNWLFFEIIWMPTLIVSINFLTILVCFYPKVLFSPY